MDFFQKKFLTLLERSRKSGGLQVSYALAVEALLIGFLFFMGLFTIETLLPTFVTVRFSLTKFFFFLTLTTFVLSLLGRFLGLSFSSNITKKNLFLWLGVLWATGILVISLIKFPWPLIPIVVVLFLFSGFLFWKIILAQEN